MRDSLDLDCEVTIKDLAQLFDISERRVRDLKARGIIPSRPNGRFSLRAATMAYTAHLRETAAGRAPGETEPDKFDLVQERARLAAAQADAQEIKTAILRGDVALRSDVDRAVGAAFARVKARLRAVGPKLAPVVVTASGPVEAQAMILTAIDEALLELSGTTVADLRGDDDDDGVVAASEAAAEDDGEPVGG